MTKSEKVYRDKSSLYYRSCRWDMIALIPENCQYILDVGCAEGVTGRAIKEQRPGAKVVGIENNQDAANKARRVLDRVIVGDVESVDLEFGERPFDCILFGDVLEHLIDPWSTLRKYRKSLDKNGCVVVSIPNIQHYSVILGLIKGDWSYQDRGILDRTHLRFFTYKEVVKLLDQPGLVPVQVSYNIRLIEHTKSRREYAELISRFLPFLRKYFVFQYVVLAAPKKGG